MQCCAGPPEGWCSRFQCSPSQSLCSRDTDSGTCTMVFCLWIAAGWSLCEETEVRNDLCYQLNGVTLSQVSDLREGTLRSLRGVSCGKNLTTSVRWLRGEAMLCVKHVGLRADKLGGWFESLLALYWGQILTKNDILGRMTLQRTCHFHHLNNRG